MGYLIGSLARRWPTTGIPYRIDAAVKAHPTAGSTLAEAIAHWNHDSDLKLVPDKSETATDHIIFVVGKKDTGGGSQLGKVGGGQHVTMDFEWDKAELSLLHEIGHAAGLVHEHQRPDRVHRVEVKPIPATNKKAKGDIDIRTDCVPVGPYDCRSLLHYTEEDPFVDVQPNPLLLACTELSNDKGLTVGDQRALSHLAGGRFQILATRTWGQGWTHVALYTSGFDSHYVIYSAVDGTVHFDHLKDGGSTTTLGGGAGWRKGWDQLVTLESGNDRFLLVYDAADGAVRIDRIKADQSGSSNVWAGTWAKSWYRVVALGLGGEARNHVLVYDRGSGVTRLDRLGDAGQGTSNRWQATLPTGLDVVSPFRLGSGDWRIACYDRNSGRAHVFRIEPQGPVEAHAYQWAPGWTHLSFHPDSVEGYGTYARVLVYNRDTGAVHFDRYSGVDGWQIEVSSTFAPGWDLLQPVFLGVPAWGNVGMLAYRRSDGQVHVDRLL